MSEGGLPVKEIFYGFVVGAITYWVQAKYPNADPALSAGVSWLAGLITLCISMQLANAEQAKHNRIQVDRAIRLAEMALKAGVVNHRLTRHHAVISKMDAIIQHVSFAAMETALHGLKVNYENSHVEIPGRRLALISYTEFWASILNIQRNFFHSSRGHDDTF